MLVTAGPAAFEDSARIAAADRPRERELAGVLDPRAGRRGSEQVIDQRRIVGQPR